MPDVADANRQKQQGKERDDPNGINQATNLQLPMRETTKAQSIHNIEETQQHTHLKHTV